MDYKQLDRERILSYLKIYPISTIDVILQESGAARFRVYPILFELSQEKRIRVVEESEWGAPVKVELIVDGL